MTPGTNTRGDVGVESEGGYQRRLQTTLPGHARTVVAMSAWTPPANNGYPTGGQRGPGGGSALPAAGGPRLRVASSGWRRLGRPSTVAAPDPIQDLPGPGHCRARAWQVRSQ